MKLRVYYFKLFIIIILHSSCKQQDVKSFNNKVYYDCRCNPIIRLFQFTNHPGTFFSFDSSSLYRYNSCGIIEHGTWERKDNKLILHCIERKFRLDTFNIYGYNGYFIKCLPNPEQLKIKRRILYQKVGNIKNCYCEK